MALCKRTTVGPGIDLTCNRSGGPNYGHPMVPSGAYSVRLDPAGAPRF